MPELTAKAMNYMRKNPISNIHKDLEDKGYNIVYTKRYNLCVEYREVRKQLYIIVYIIIIGNTPRSQHEIDRIRLELELYFHPHKLNGTFVDDTVMWFRVNMDR